MVTPYVGRCVGIFCYCCHEGFRYVVAAFRWGDGYCFSYCSCECCCCGYACVGGGQIRIRLGDWGWPTVDTYVVVGVEGKYIPFASTVRG